MSSILPPRKKNWTPGQYQIGLFIRTPDGCVIESSWDKPTQEIVDKALAVLINKFKGVLPTTSDAVSVAASETAPDVKTTGT
jgi:hypothetical protein